MREDLLDGARVREAAAEVTAALRELWSTPGAAESGLRAFVEHGVRGWPE